MKCPNCGTELPDIAKFCANCGSPVSAPSDTPEAASETTAFEPSFEQPTTQLPTALPELDPMPFDQMTPDYTTPISPVDMMSSTEEFPYAPSAAPTGYDPNSQTGSLYDVYPQQSAPSSSGASPTPPSSYNPYGNAVNFGVGAAGAAGAAGAGGAGSVPPNFPQPPRGQQYQDPYPADPKKKGGIGKIVAIVLAVFIVLGVGGAVYGTVQADRAAEEAEQAETLRKADEARQKAEADAEARAQAEEEKQKAEEAQQQQAQREASFAGVWKLTGLVSDGEVEDISILDEMDMECLLTLANDKTATLDLFGEVESGTWRANDDGTATLVIGLSRAAMQLDSDGNLVMADGTDSLTFALKSEAPETTSRTSSGFDSQAPAPGSRGGSGGVRSIEGFRS